MKLSYREALLNAYRLASVRQRARLVRKFVSSATFPASVLFYHRVANTSPNDWSISKVNFDRQIDWLQRHTSLVNLDTIVATQQSGDRPTHMASITFDDGYSENCDHALPMLVRRRIPCHYFISTHFVESGEAFPHDIKAGQVLRPNTIEEIKYFAGEGVEIGAHSHMHPDFGRDLSKDTLRREIADCRKKIQDWTGQPVNYFAFPYGLKNNVSQAAIDMVFESGYKAFLSASGGMNLPGADSKHIQRIHGDPGMAAFKNWLTFDPRKVFSPSPISYTYTPPVKSNSSRDPSSSKVFKYSLTTT